MLLNNVTVERSHEAYVKNYAMVFIHDENLAKRDMRIDPLHETVCTYSLRRHVFAMLMTSLLLW